MRDLYTRAFGCCARERLRAQRVRGGYYTRVPIPPYEYLEEGAIPEGESGVMWGIGWVGSVNTLPVLLGDPRPRTGEQG